MVEGPFCYKKASVRRLNTTPWRNGVHSRFAMLIEASMVPVQGGLERTMVRRVTGRLIRLPAFLRGVRI